MKHTWRILVAEHDEFGHVIRRTFYRFRATGRTVNALIERWSALGRAVLVTRL